MYHSEHLKNFTSTLGYSLPRKIPLHYQTVNMDSLSYLREISVYLLPHSSSITLPPRDFQAPLHLSQLHVNTANKPSGTQSPFCNCTREEATLWPQLWGFENYCKNQNCTEAKNVFLAALCEHWKWRKVHIKFILFCTSR